MLQDRLHLEVHDVTEESPQYYKNVGSLHTDVEINVAPADSKIYMEKKSKNQKSPRHFWRLEERWPTNYKVSL